MKFNGRFLSDLNETWNVLIMLLKLPNIRLADDMLGGPGVVSCVQKADIWRDEANLIGVLRRYEHVLKPAKPGNVSNSFHSNLNFV